MNRFSNIITRRNIIIAVFLVFIIFVAILYFSFSLITVTSSENAEIRVTKVGDSSVDHTGKGKVTFWGTRGDYLATADYLLASSKKTFHANSFTFDTKVDLNEANTDMRPVPVIPYDANRLSFRSGRLFYRDSSDESIYSLAPNSPQVPRPEIDLDQYSDVKWFGDGTGVGRQDGYLYYISGDKLEVITSDFNNDDCDYYLSTKKKYVYLSCDNRVKVTKDLGKTFSDVMSTVQIAPIVKPSANSDAFLIIDSLASEDSSTYEIDNAEYGPDEKFTMYVYSNSKDRKGSIDSGIITADISDDGNVVAVSDETGLSLYKTSNLSSKSLVSQTHFRYLAWSGKTLLSSVDRDVWATDTSSNSSSLIAKLPIQGSVTGVYHIADTNYISYQSSGMGYLAKISNNQADTQSQSTYDLGVYLPLYVDETCSASYNNIADPIVSYDGGGSCLSTLQRTLSNSGVDISKYNFQAQ